MRLNEDQKSNLLVSLALMVLGLGLLLYVTHELFQSIEMLLVNMPELLELRLNELPHHIFEMITENGRLSDIGKVISIFMYVFGAIIVALITLGWPFLFTGFFGVLLLISGSLILVLTIKEIFS